VSRFEKELGVKVCRCSALNTACSVDKLYFTVLCSQESLLRSMARDMPLSAAFVEVACISKSYW